MVLVFNFPLKDRLESIKENMFLWCFDYRKRTAVFMYIAEWYQADIKHLFYHAGQLNHNGKFTHMISNISGNFISFPIHNSKKLLI